MDDLFGTQNSQHAADPASDFLARERELLGADAGQFAHPTDSTTLEKDYEQSAAAFPDLDDAGDDGLGSFTGAPVQASGGAPAQVGHQVSVTGANEFAAFEQEYPEIELPSEQPHDNGLNGIAPAPSPIGLAAPAFNQSAPATPAPQEEGESEFIKSWREKQAQEIAKREEEATQKKEDTIAKARNAIDNFYKEYNAKKEKAIAQNKEDEEKFKTDLSDSLAKGTTWERICTLIDLQDSRSKTTTKSKQDLTRFKELLLSLRREGETAPGAAGY
ncbi:clathrin light chain [Rhodotorula toruloides]|uniref:Clathrin light chain n=1 Tax=Rhodotorula toruloides TaxID=5286 RepID=A0A511KG71_RHOTO|nr:clathrin light chain [Rhodotorula toruloides]